MVGIFHESRYLRQEGQHNDDEKQRRGAHGDERGGVDFPRVFPGLVDITEKRGFHAVGEEHQQQRRIGIDVGHHPVFSP